MSFNLIKLKKVPGKVSFDTNTKIHLYRNSRLRRTKNNLTQKENSISFQTPKEKTKGASTDRIQSKMSANISNLQEQPSPRMIRIKTTKITAHNKTNAFELKRIAEDITMIGKEIERFVSASPPRENYRRSITPPPIPGFKVTKQSFPDQKLKFPRVKRKA